MRSGISEGMRGVLSRLSLLAFFLLAALAPCARAQASPDTFRWVDFHSPEDQSVVVWVSRALEVEKWTAIREIGVQWDAALVVTAQRASPQAPPSDDIFQVWSVSLTDHSVTPLLLKAVGLRWVEPMRFAETAPPAPAALYEDCVACAATTYFTAFYYDQPRHAWSAHWMRNGRAAALLGPAPPEGVTLTQVYAPLSDPSGGQLIATWSHYDYGKSKPSDDYLYRYDLDPWSHVDRVQLISGKEAEPFKQRLCHAQPAVKELAGGQDSVLCGHAAPPARARMERHPVTTPPANNQGKSTPPGSRRP